MAVPAAPAKRTPCILVNPRSFRVSRNSLAADVRRVARAFGIDVLEVASAPEIQAGIDSLLANAHQPVFILAGDGTVHAVADRLAALPDHVARPPLFVLGGGRSNVTAAALGGRGAVLRKLEEALRRWRDGPALARERIPMLRVEQPPAPPRHGFLLVAGLLDAILRACHREQERNRGTWRAGNASNVRAVLELALPGVLLGREPPLDDLNLTIAGWSVPSSPARLLLMTTLAKRPGMLDPYAERGEGPLRFSALCARGAGLWTRLPAVALGRGKLSGRCDALQVQGLSRYTLDGEEFTADPTRTACIRSGPAIAFLTL